MLLAGDIGGTKTSLGIFSRERGPRAPLTQATFPSGRYPSLEALVQEFLQGVTARVDRASFGVAGPVFNGTAKITNLPWVMDEKRLASSLGLRSVRLLNDLAAIAHGVPHLESADVFTINSGRAAPHGTLAVVAPGTGLGEAFMTWDSGHYRVHGSEGGHADFAPVGEQQIGLLRYLQDRLDHVSFERVCSGRGIPNIYAYLKDTGFAPEPAWLAGKIATAPDATPVIVGAALDASGDALCQATVQMFLAILAAEAGNIALKVMAVGGVYLGGGIPPRLVSLFQTANFLDAFRHKGRLADLLHDIPVHVILHPEIALLGAAYHGLEARPD
ncbi:MAG: glucokinase [Chloroflexota bacterium]